MLADTGASYLSNQETNNGRTRTVSRSGNALSRLACPSSGPAVAIRTTADSHRNIHTMRYANHHEQILAGGVCALTWDLRWHARNIPWSAREFVGNGLHRAREHLRHRGDFAGWWQGFSVVWRYHRPVRRGTILRRYVLPEHLVAMCIVLLCKILRLLFIVPDTTSVLLIICFTMVEFLCARRVRLRCKQHLASRGERKARFPKTAAVVTARCIEKAAFGHILRSVVLACVAPGTSVPRSNRQGTQS